MPEDSQTSIEDQIKELTIDVGAAPARTHIEGDVFMCLTLAMAGHSESNLGGSSSAGNSAMAICYAEGDTAE